MFVNWALGYHPSLDHRVRDAIEDLGLVDLDQRCDDRGALSAEEPTADMNLTKEDRPSLGTEATIQEPESRTTSEDTGKAAFNSLLDRLGIGADERISVCHKKPGERFAAGQVHARSKAAGAAEAWAQDACVWYSVNPLRPGTITGRAPSRQ